MAPNPYQPKNLLFLSKPRLQHNGTPPPPYTKHALLPLHPSVQHYPVDIMSNRPKGNMSNYGGHAHQGGHPNIPHHLQTLGQLGGSQAQPQPMPPPQNNISLPPNIQHHNSLQHHSSQPGHLQGLGLGFNINTNIPGGPPANQHSQGHIPGFPPTHLNSSGFNVKVTTQDDSDSDDEGESDPPFSEIHIKINTPLSIIGSSNLVAVDPSNTANRVAMGVVSALKSISIAQGGIPMIDEEGRPRPIKIDVQCDTIIQGENNVVGERAFLQAITPQITDRLKERFESNAQGGEVKEDKENRKREMGREGGGDAESGLKRSRLK